MNHSTIRDGERWDASVGRWVPMPSIENKPKAQPRAEVKAISLSGVDDRGWHHIFESSMGAWQRDIVVDYDNVLSNPYVYACMTLIASDMGKLWLRLMEQHSSGIWQETNSPAFSPVLRKPNHFQTRQQFVESWMISKLGRGNTYGLKQRDMRGVVTAIYVLDPTRVRPLVAPDGSVFYELNSDDLSRLPFDIPAIPASEIIHDRMECLFHPLVGISPIFACGLAATQGLRILNNSAKFFENMSRPSGILSAPGQISDETARRLKEHWEKNYRADNIGKIAVLGDALSYIPMATTAVDADLVDQFKLSAEQICSAFHVPPYMIGVGPMPTYNNIEALSQQYYNQCLQKLIEAFEACMDEGLGLWNVEGKMLRTEFDLDDLLRMDTATRVKTWNERVGGGWTKPNEARAAFNQLPAKGGDSPMLQQQNYSLEALAKRDAAEDPFASNTPAPAEPIPADERAALIEHTRELATASKTLEGLMGKMEREADFAASIRAARAKFDAAEVE